MDTLNGETLTVSPAGTSAGAGLLFRGRQSAATSVQTDLRTCRSIVDFVNQVHPVPLLAGSLVTQAVDELLLLQFHAGKGGRRDNCYDQQLRYVSHAVESMHRIQWPCILNSARRS